ncbi:unnamed protein product [Paramecium primaurelia]|uniref:Uncharacterized protein n=3 Tax=Paramecium TaxID=5884 RepID=A0A8S1U2L4_PAROT|nr:unnamed protein product [Paramecium primaurelia]CAD8157555.1 unnamed protein product [Paramecium pentaurelia]CAD8159921.1 unnamed protein product [Paramecium octaurelia]
MADPIKIVMCILCCPQWFSYYSFLHNCARTCDITSKIFKGIGSTLWKVLFVLFMAFCGFELVNCVLCIVGCVHCFGAPFQAYQGGSTWVDSFHKMVLEPSCDFEGKISDILGKMFKH